MKQIKLSIAVLTLFVFTISSCKKEALTTIPSTPTTSSLVVQGSWKITLYDDKGEIETAKYTGYDFAFNLDGTLIAKGTSTVNGTWNTGTDDSLNKLNIDFGSTIPFDKLSDDWHILEKTSSLIRLEDVSGGKGGVGHLTFEKK